MKVTTQTDEVAALLEARVAAAVEQLGARELPKPEDGEPYSRTILHTGPDCEVMVARWRGTWSAPHDHGGRRGLVKVLRGRVEERSYGSRGTTRELAESESLTCGGSDVHALRGDPDAVTVHAYAGHDGDFRVFSDDLNEVWHVPSAHGAWLPKRARRRQVVWIGFTTSYRGGSREFARAAETLAAAKRQELPDADVRVAALEFKRDFVRAMGELEREGASLGELHFIGHSGMYGIMFGSTKWPEQLSPHEWRGLAIPFAKGARAYFHACRTARWFAGFFAGIYGVETFGHHGYTSMSKTPDRFTRLRSKRDPVFVVSCPGKKTHGLGGSVKKYLLAAKTFPMTCFTKEASVARAGYDAVAPLYAAAFEDIGLRDAEMKWLGGELDRLPVARPRVLDLGCGTGSLLRALAPRIGESVGVDVSTGMIEEAQKRSDPDQLSFRTIEGPLLPFPDQSFDVVVSFLSFRYLDWDPVVQEIARVLGPNGRLLIVDMVEKPWDLLSAPLLARGLWRSVKSRLSSGGQHRALRELVKQPAWKEMVRTNPIRAEHEYRWYLESRFPGAKLRTLDVTPTKRTVAFVSGPMHEARLTPLAYP